MRRRLQRHRRHRDDQRIRRHRHRRDDRRHRHRRDDLERHLGDRRHELPDRRGRTGEASWPGWDGAFRACQQEQPEQLRLHVQPGDAERCSACPAWTRTGCCPDVHREPWGPEPWGRGEVRGSDRRAWVQLRPEQQVLPEPERPPPEQQVLPERESVPEPESAQEPCGDREPDRACAKAQPVPRQPESPQRVRTG